MVKSRAALNPTLYSRRKGKPGKPHLKNKLCLVHRLGLRNNNDFYSGCDYFTLYRALRDLFSLAVLSDNAAWL
jgi:hypothetical protein